MLSFIELFVSAIGIYGFFSNNLLCSIIGLVGIIICDFIDIFLLGHNPTTIFIAILLGVGITISNHNPLSTFTILICGENFIMSFLTILYISINFIVSKKHKYEN